MLLLVGAGECWDTLTSLKTCTSVVWGIHNLWRFVRLIVPKLAMPSSTHLSLSIKDFGNFRKLSLTRVIQARALNIFCLYITSYIVGQASSWLGTRPRHFLSSFFRTVHRFSLRSPVIFQSQRLWDWWLCSQEEHSHLNHVKGTTYYRNRCNITNDELLQELRPWNVRNVYKTSKNVASEILFYNFYIHTFRSKTLPEEVNIGWNKGRVREYIPQPRRSFKCQGFQHSSKTCRSECDICVNCAQEARGASCSRPPCCKNCNGDHPSSSKCCYYYNLAHEIVILQNREKLSFREARFRVLESKPKPEKMYSRQLTRTDNSLPNTNANCSADLLPSTFPIATTNKKRKHNETSIWHFYFKEEETTRPSSFTFWICHLWAVNHRGLPRSLSLSKFNQVTPFLNEFLPWLGDQKWLLFPHQHTQRLNPVP